MYQLKTRNFRKLNTKKPFPPPPTAGGREGERNIDQWNRGQNYLRTSCFNANLV